MLERELEAALAAVRAASRACSAVRGHVDVGTLDKSDRSPVTVADFASQALVVRELAERFPDDPLVAEEDSARLREPGNRALLERVASACGAPAETVLGWIDHGAGAPGRRFWCLDPIDGTKGFLRNEQYAVALALLEEGRVVLGVLGCPNLPGGALEPSAAGAGSLLWAVRGGGTWQQPIAGGTVRRVHASGSAEIAAVRVCESVESGHTRHDLAADAVTSLGIAGAPVRADSQVKYALVARGDAEVYWRLPTRPGYEERIWDHAAGSILVEEAGGRVSDAFGAPLDFTRGRTLAANRGVLATHGPHHRQIAEELGRRIGAAR